MQAKPITAAAGALGPLLEKRRAARHGAERALARAHASRSAAASAVARAADALELHRSSRPQLAAATGEVSALELQRGAAFARRHGERAARLTQQLEQAQRALAEQEGLLERARLALARASADERALERHETERARALGRRRERREQDAVDEQTAARIFARKGSAL